MLFDARAHEPLVSAGWEPAAVQAEISAIAREAEDMLRGGQWWPVHPLDAEPGDPEVFHGIYLGAAGVLWALHRLAQAGLHEPRHDHARLAQDVLDSYLAHPELDGPLPSLWMGEGGIALVAWLLSPTQALADRLAQLVVVEPDRDTLELMWGSPGLLLIADVMLERTGDRRWAAAWSAIADHLMGQWGAHVPDFWTQRLYGSTEEILGPAHGLAGVVAALARRPDLLPAGRLLPGPPRPCRPPRSARASSRTGRPRSTSRSPSPTAPSAPSGATAPRASWRPAPPCRAMTASTRCCSPVAS